MSDHDFPRPYSVQMAEAQTLAQEVTLDDPTYDEALVMEWQLMADDLPLEYGLMTASQLGESAKRAQGLFLLHAQTRPMDTGAVRQYWRAMRAAQLVLAFRDTQRFGGPYHA